MTNTTWPLLWRLTASGPTMVKAADHKGPYPYWPGVEHWQPGYCWQWVYTASTEEEWTDYQGIDDGDTVYHAALTQRAWLCALVSLLEVLNTPELVKAGPPYPPPIVPWFPLALDKGPAFVLPAPPAHLRALAPELAAKVESLPRGSEPFHLGPGLTVLPGGKK